MKNLEEKKKANTMQTFEFLILLMRIVMVVMKIIMIIVDENVEMTAELCANCLLRLNNDNKVSISITATALIRTISLTMTLKQEK